MKSTKTTCGIALVMLCSLVVTLKAQDLYVGSGGTNGIISKFQLDGSTVNASLISGLNGPVGIAISGTNLFVANFYAGTVGEYTTSGATVNASLISGLSGPIGIAISGDHLFVANYYTATIGEYTTSGATVNASLISVGFSPGNIAVSGDDLFVAYDGPSGIIAEYTTTGATVNASLISGPYNFRGIAVLGNKLFVANDFYGISEYTTAGATVNLSLISVILGEGIPEGVAISGDNLYVVNIKNGTVGEYTTSGATINASLISGLNMPNGIAISPVQPPNLSISRIGTNVTISWPVAGSYTLQQSTNMTRLSWSSSGLPNATNNGIISTTIPASANRLFFRLSNP